ncbi:MAG: metallophosphoesterase, partial [Bacteroidota bacterium]
MIRFNLLKHNTLWFRRVPLKNTTAKMLVNLNLLRFLERYFSMAKYAISDIHGCSKSFQALLEKINFSPKDELYLLGDYIDRGPDSKGVIDHVLSLKED